MNWEYIVLLVLIFVGYSYLLSSVRNKSISGLVALHVEYQENDKEVSSEMEIFKRNCQFIVTPVPGMEYMPAGIEGAEIKRVLIDEHGLLKLICLLTVTASETKYHNTCEHLQKEGWNKSEFA